MVAARKFYLLILDTMNLVKTASTYVELWGLQGWEDKDWKEEEAHNFTCQVKLLPRPTP